MGEEQEGLGMIPGASQAPGGEAKYVATPNTSLQMLNNKRVGDNVVQEQKTEVTLNSIREQAKQQLIQGMAQKQAMEQAVRAREVAAIDHGRNVGRSEGLDLGLTKGYEYGVRDTSPGALEDEDTTYAQNYAMNDTEDGMNNEMDYVDNSGLGMV